MSNFRSSSLFLFGLLLFGSMSLPAQSIFTNSSSITIQDDDVSAPYPSTITVAGLGTALANTPTAVSIRLNNVSHTCPDDIGIALVGPTGAAFLLQDGGGDCTDLVNVTYSLRDSASAALPNTGVWTAGVFKPTANYASPLNALFPAPGPVTTYNAPASFGSSTLQSTFAGTNPNGVWSLYIVDSVAGDSGAIAGGWSLSLTTTASAADATVSGNVLSPDGRGLSGAVVTLTNNQGVSRSVTSSRRGSFAFTEVETGESYVLTVQSRLFPFQPRVITVTDSLTGIELVGEDIYGSR